LEHQLEATLPLLLLDDVETRRRPSRVASLEVRFDLYAYMRSAS
jgi:hypothetical protein